MTDERELIEGLQKGEPWAFDRFYRTYATTVLGWAIRMGGPNLDAEDIAQDVFTVALRKIGGFRFESALSTWLYAITRNLISNARRKAAIRRWIGLDSVAELPSYAPDQEEQLQAARRRLIVQQALETLSDRPREVLVLMDLEGRSAPEVSEMLNIPVGTIYSRLHYARKKFAKALERQGLTKTDLLGAVSASGSVR